MEKQRPWANDNLDLGTPSRDGQLVDRLGYAFLYSEKHEQPCRYYQKSKGRSGGKNEGVALRFVAGEIARFRSLFGEKLRANTATLVLAIY